MPARFQLGRLNVKKLAFLASPPLWRGTVLVVLALITLWWVAREAQGISPLGKWWAWDFVVLWLGQLGFVAACLSFGNLVISRLVDVELPLLEQLVLGMATGVVAFVVLMYAGGAVGLLSPTFAVLLPLTMFLSGARSWWSPALRSLRAPRAARSLSFLQFVIGGAGCIAAGLLYLQCMTPESLGYDAAWSHLTIAEDYAREGRLVPFIAETPKNLPHLASLLYTWAFLWPGLHHPALQWMAAQHLEFVLFLWTLAGVGAQVAWILPQRRVPAAWAAYFLFPGIYVYDGNLGAAADHVAAFFAAPLFLMGLRACWRFSPAMLVLAGAFAGALLHTKFQSLYLVAPMCVALALRGLWFMGQRLVSRLRGKSGEDEGQPLSWRRLWGAPAFFVLGVTLGFGPHLLTNFVFYDNPFYPLFLDHFQSTPSIPGFPLDPNVQALARPPFLERLQETVRLIAIFSFEPQAQFIGPAPVFGSLFTLLSPTVLLFPRDKRLWVGFLLAFGALSTWAWVYRIDRNLQVILPWLVAFTAAVIVRVWDVANGSRWRLVHGTRLGIIVLVGIQLAWGSRLMIAGGQARIEPLFDWVKADFTPGAEKKRYDRFRRGYRTLGESLPKDAVVLLHTGHIHLGINRRVLSDWAGWQYVIDYRAMKTPKDVYDRYKQLGITHIIWNNYDFPSIKQEDVLFHTFVRRHAKPARQVGGFSVWEMPKNAPPEEESLQVAALGLDGYGNGLYSIERLNVVEDLPDDQRTFPPPNRPLDTELQASAVLSPAEAVLLAGHYRLSATAKTKLDKCFERVHSYYRGYRIANYAVYLRRAGIRPSECLEGENASTP